MAESFNLSVGAMGSEQPRGRIGKNRSEISLDDALRAIRNLPVSKQDKKTLSDLAKKVPSGSLRNFLSNYSNHLKKP